LGEPEPALTLFGGEAKTASIEKGYPLTCGFGFNNGGGEG